jgi:hypothetical protein
LRIALQVYRDSINSRPVTVRCAIVIALLADSAAVEVIASQLHAFAEN